MHSKIADSDSIIPAELKNLIVATSRSATKPTKKEAEETIRAMLNTVGKAGQPGAQVRCVVSVSMLTEGWDARTVTHVVGFRVFSTQLLCEQVTGRALRRTSYDAFRDGEPNTDSRARFGDDRTRRKRKKGLKADYRGATPEQVAEKLLRTRVQPGMRSKRFLNPSRDISI